jgi:MFS family permease
MPRTPSTRSGEATAGSDAAAPLLRSASHSTLSSSFLSEDENPRPPSYAVSRNFAFACAVLSALCAGSVAVFSLYGHIFQERLHYSQFQVNGVAIAASIASYLPVPVMGYICDRVGPAPLSAISAVLFGIGYSAAALLYHRAATAPVGGKADGVHPVEYVGMIAAFTMIGVGTCSMYLSAVATCAKNFGKGKHRGLALAVPIAAYGLSGVWESQFASQVLYERLPDGTKGDVDVFRFFLFLAGLLFVVGAIGTFGLRIVDEQDLIDDAVEELERSGILDGSTLLTPGRTENGYGAIDRRNPFADVEDPEGADANKDPEEEAARFKKQWVLNAETRHFLTDHTMWYFALGFFFVIGPGEAFVNNLGTIIKTLYPPTMHFHGTETSAATHISILALTSTVMRLLTGSLTDLLAPSPQEGHVQITPTTPMLQRLKFSVSRVAFWLFFAVITSLGFAILAAGVVQNHGERFWIVSALVGAGYGAVFSLTPIIITVIWGVENFGTNWGIVAMFPALGATIWGLIYSAVYQSGADKSRPFGPDGELSEWDNLCYGSSCYAPTFWGMAVSVWLSVGLVLWAWKGRNGWAQRGIVI